MIRRSVALLAVAVLLSACTSAEEPPPDFDLDETASSEYVAALEDGEVSEEEYTAGYRRFVTCIEGKGWEVHDLGRPSTVYDYGIPEAAHLNGDFDACWDREFKEIELLWQVANPPTTAATPRFIACLEEAGLPTDGDEGELQVRLEENGIDIQDCLEG